MFVQRKVGRVFLLFLLFVYGKYLRKVRRPPEREHHSSSPLPELDSASAFLFRQY
jgi:hypothetical protein